MSWTLTSWTTKKVQLQGHERSATSSAPCDEPGEGVQRLIADMVLESFGIAAGDLRGDAQREQELFDQPVTFAASQREIVASLGQERAAIRLLRDETVLGETFQHFRDGRLGDAETRRDVDLSRLPAVIDQIGDELDIILHQGGSSRRARLPETLDMKFSGDERLDGVGRGRTTNQDRSRKAVDDRPEANA